MKKNKSVVKGAPSGFVVSLMVHAAAFMLAGMLVVFNVVKKEEKKFVPPKPVERPKMKLKKPKVKVKKSAKPKSTTRIVTKVQRANMPDIQLPEMSGIGDGIGSGIGGFDIVPNLNEMASPFGDTFTTGNDLKGHFYNFNRSRSGAARPMSPDQFENLIHVFLKRGWAKSVLAPYYRSLTTLYSSTICIPTVMSELAPQSFGEGEAGGYCWAVLYEGDLVYPEDITFRFWGVGDKFMAASVDDDTVLFCAYKSSSRELFGDVWQSKDSKDNTYYFGEHRARPSDWITLKAGEPRRLKVIMGDLEGGLVYHMLSVEVKGEQYPNTRAGGGPTFPIFRTGEISRDVQDRIYSNLYPGDACLTNGPIFRDYIAKTVAEVQSQPEVEPVQPIENLSTVMRVWTALNGNTIEGRFRTMMGKTVVLENAKKKQIKLPFDQLIEEDRKYIELGMPPAFTINWLRKSSQVQNPPLSPWGSGSQRPLQIFNFSFGVDIRQKISSVPYNHELNVEYFAIGDEVDGKNQVLLEKNTAVFNPAEYAKQSFILRGKDVEIRQMAYRDAAPMRGTKYGGYLVVITDTRGEVVGYKTSHEYLFNNLAELRTLSENNHFNRNGERVIPARPTEDNRGNGAIDGN